MYFTVAGSTVGPLSHGMQPHMQGAHTAPHATAHTYVQSCTVCACILSCNAHGFSLHTTAQATAHDEHSYNLRSTVHIHI